MRTYKPSKKTDEQFKGWHLIYPIGSFQSTKDTPPSSDSDRKLDERRALHLKAKNSEKEKNPEADATGETP